MKLFAYIDDALNAAHDLVCEATNAVLDKIDGFDDLPMPDMDRNIDRLRKSIFGDTDTVHRDITGCPIDK